MHNKIDRDRFDRIRFSRKYVGRHRVEKAKGQKSLVAISVSVVSLVALLCLSQRALRGDTSPMGRS